MLTALLTTLGPVKPQSFGEAWRAAGLESEQTAVRRDALPPLLFAQVQRDALAIARDAQRPREWKDKFGKLPTNWLPVRAGGGWEPPRTAIEAAVHHLHALVFGGQPAPWVAGAEWWVQQQEAISFHYDKDEAMASEQMTMAYPGERPPGPQPSSAGATPPCSRAQRCRPSPTSRRTARPRWCWSR